MKLLQPFCNLKGTIGTDAKDCNESHNAIMGKLGGTERCENEGKHTLHTPRVFDNDNLPINFPPQMSERAKRVSSFTLRGMGRTGKNGAARQSWCSSLVDQVDDEREILPLVVGWQQDADAARWIGRHKRSLVIWQYTRAGGDVFTSGCGC